MSDEWIGIDEFCKIFEITKANAYTTMNLNPNFKAYTKRYKKRRVINKAILRKRNKKIQNREFCQKRYYEIVDDLSESKIAKYLASKSDRFKSHNSWQMFINKGMWIKRKIKIGRLFRIDMFDEMSHLLKDVTSKDIVDYIKGTR